MKKIFSIALTGICLFSATSCKKYLDVNNNPNQPTTATPALVLPQALTATAALIVNTGDFNTYGSELNGYFGNAGGFGSLGPLISYAFTTGDKNGLFNNTYDNLEDYQYIIDNPSSNAVYVAAANVMRAYDFQLLVDTYNDVPYTEALKGLGKLQPKYDKGADIYKDLGDKLDAAIAVLNTATADATFVTADVMFKGDVKKWAQFANTLKLRLILRAGDKVTFTKPTPDATAGFLTTDAAVQPGYTKVAGKQNPLWDRWAYSETGAARGAGAVYMPSPYVLAFFDGTKLIDDNRGYAYFFNYNGLSTPKNRLGYTEADAPKAPTPVFFYANLGRTEGYIGVLKAETQSQPLMLASESYFLQAEGALKGIVTGGNATTSFNAGIKASFRYLYSDANGAVVGPVDVDYAQYVSDNATNRLANLDVATTPAQKLEAIITQKYIALAFQFGHETWSEYRRTGYPAITGNTATTTFASIVSQSTAPDRLPTRVLYPVSEYTYNSGNVPSGISPYTSKIFWAK
ncbi:MAG: SusD/RagB family nutrient-binding outer membrane lipoprotein [Bacteroidota bacterium]